MLSYLWEIYNVFIGKEVPYSRHYRAQLLLKKGVLNINITTKKRFKNYFLAWYVRGAATNWEYDGAGTVI